MKIVKEPMYINKDCGRIIKETSLISLLIYQITGHLRVMTSCVKL